MNRSVIQHEEDKALHLNDSHGDTHVKAIDICLWQCAVQAARVNPSQSAAHYRLTADTIEALAEATPHQIERLASATACSFIIRNDEREIIHKLNTVKDSGLGHCSKPIWSFHLQYWISVQRCLLKDRSIAKVAFGLSNNILDAIENATAVDFSDFIMTSETIFNLRFGESTINRILSGEPTEGDIFRRLQQSLNVNSIDLGGLYA